VIVDEGEGAEAATIAARLAEAVRRRPGELLGLEEAQRELDRLAREAPALVRTVVPGLLELPRFSGLLRALLAEGVSVRPLREILEAVAASAVPADDDALLAGVRERLGRPLTHAHLRGGTLTARAVDPMIEEAVREALVDGEAALAPELAREVVETSVEGMVETLSCDWASVLFEAEPSLLGELSGETFEAGSTRDGVGVLEEARRLVSLHHGEGSMVLTPEVNGGQAAIIQPVRMRARCVGQVVMAGKRDETGDISSFDTQLMEAVAACISSLLETIKLYDEQAETFVGTLRAFSSSLDAKDPYTRGHSERVALLARDLALASGMGVEDAERVHMAGTMHDIGKIGVPDHVLGKPGRLTDDEFEMIKRHPSIGYEILKPIPTVEDILPGVLYHHERWDGRGYPSGLSGDEIPMMARVLAVADTFDAMSSNRAYRPAKSRDEVLAEIERCAGSQFDPELVPAFLSMDLAPFDEMLTRHICEQVDSQAAAEARGDAEAA